MVFVKFLINIFSDAARVWRDFIVNKRAIHNGRVMGGVQRENGEK
jgi:hypothetical protein